MRIWETLERILRERESCIGSQNCTQKDRRRGEREQIEGVAAVYTRGNSEIVAMEEEKEEEEEEATRKQTAFELSIRSQEAGNQSQRASDGAATAPSLDFLPNIPSGSLLPLPSPCRSRHLLVLSTFRLSSNIHSVQEVSCFSQVFAKFREGLRTGSPSSSSPSSLRSLSCLLSLARSTHIHNKDPPPPRLLLSA